ncbi:MAG: hypothetical protein A2Z91_04630 [Deltaproteobacteria bacterium GWA2_38_16]|nr:MAG: hypothetical protein A2Z91_04630 [Deltaproteobacteria bacterium GWA2_38_16]OGQ01712.1 MAG: hypothetical protein A3D19_07550 [Deltaproteobacteria bacterium RIFCSPHIGHO2_02_FULL_38_15]OGQ34828.1 MAG: hypothetical protein A3A72_05420 [Deltaproteobacteria bacterium RIFCSPLOWO2_01_FULL_38_9]OGQ61220.1 MAG: hypothetical protein A3G92_00255 [Deltaproteobacteria bacterium RIFCSPLOWO2_12_FULL_38_8]HBQ21485.1 hypothetical protein [Deltaproteobacteria bacterium]
MDLSIIIPCYNEAQSIGEILCALKEKYPQAEIIVIDDASTDASYSKIETVSGIIIVKHLTNMGYGASLKSGFRKATRKYICLFDADGQHHVEDIEKLYAQCKNCHMIVGERDKNFLRDYRRAFGKKILNSFANFLMKQKIPDLNSGLRIIDRDLFQKSFSFLPNGFSATTTLTLYAFANHYDVQYHPITVVKRKGRSTVSPLSDGLKMMMLILRLTILFKPLHFFLPLSGIFIAIGFIYSLWKAAIVGLGIPVGGGLIIIAGIFCFFFGLLADILRQIHSEIHDR